MGAEVQKQKKQHEAAKKPANQAKQDAPPQGRLARIGISLRQLNWRLVLITSMAMAVGWCLLVFGGTWANFLAGIVPVAAGLFLGRKVKEHLAMHGLMLGMCGFGIGFILVLIYGGFAQAVGVSLPPIPDPELPQTFKEPGFQELLVYYLSFSLFALIPFPAFGTIMAGRAEQRQREMREFEEVRGGRLERPGAVRTLEDLQGLPLPQFGSYVANLFKKRGFKFHDYRFLDKDKYLDLELEYQDEVYLLRLSVADKVRPGAVETLAQDMRQREIPKGIVITSTEFAESLKNNKRRHIVLIDGKTLFDIAEA
jgi:hypothetical protein